MVLIRTRRALLLAAGLAAGLAGCKESLFDANGPRDGGGGGGGDGGDGDIDVPDNCEEPCVADAAKNFGTDARWRYLEDQRNRRWMPMTGTTVVSGTLDGANQIQRCPEGSSLAACKALPGALLISSAGASSAADPAIEFTANEGKVLQLVVRAHAPNGGQRIRLYRNGREDLLSPTTGLAAGITFERKVVVDALPGDRFLVALAPISGGGQAAVHFFVTDTRASFPSSACQLAVPFPGEGAPGTTSVDAVCGGALNVLNNNTAVMANGRSDPFGGDTAAYFEPSIFYRGTSALPRGTATTVQFWVQGDAPNPPQDYAWLFSDHDEQLGNGFGIRLRYVPSLQIEASILSAPLPTPVYLDQSAPYPMLTDFHFVRVIHANDAVTICIDGKKALVNQYLPGPSASKLPPHFARNPGDAGTYFFGAIDDARVFSGALPCDD